MVAQENKKKGVTGNPLPVACWDISPTSMSTNATREPDDGWAMNKKILEDPPKRSKHPNLGFYSIRS